MLDTIQKRVEEKLKENGIEAYIYAFEMTDDGLPYFAYTYNKEVVEEAKELWKKGWMPVNCYDDYSYEDGIDDIVQDIYLIIVNNENRIQND
jgi:hypothetical protein